MNLYKIIKVVILIMAFSQALFAFGQEISGTVYGIDPDGMKMPLQGANMHWLGTSIGKVTDNKGGFTIERTAKSASLVVSYIGYEKDTIAVPPDINHIDIELKSILKTDEVKVYGEQPGMLMSKADVGKSEQITLQGLRKAACCNLSESFQTNPSVDVEYTDAISGAKQIQLLGLAGIYSQTLTEKIPNMRGLASSFGMEYIPGQWMESISISKGSASVQTGYESMTGQIDVEYKKPELSGPLFLSFYSNQMGRLEADATSSRQFNDNLSTMLFLHGNLMKTQIDNNKDSFLDLPMLGQINAMNRWKLISGSFGSQLIVKALYEDRRSGQMNYFPSKPDSLYGMDIKTERYEVLAKNGIVFPTENYNSLALILAGTSHNQNFFFGSNKYYGKQSSAYANLIYETRIEQNPEVAKNSDTAGLDVTKGKQTTETGGFLPAHKFEFGLSWQFDQYDETFNDSAMFNRESVPGIFGEYTLAGIYGLTLVSGLRADFHNEYGTFITPRFHLKYEVNPSLIFRASAGKGYRVPRIFAENAGLMASNRQYVIEERLKPEVAWNYGINGSYDFFLWDKLFTLNAEFYRTDFDNQVVVDMEQDVNAVHFYNLRGKSYSNSLQVDLTFSPLKRMDIITAFRMNDVNISYNGELLRKPMVNRYKAFFNIAYAFAVNDWLLDFTLNYNGGGRLPNTASNPEQYRLGSNFPAFMMLYAQFTKKFGDISLYVGGENLTDYKQPHPILSYDNPFGKYFDSSMIWGPIAGRIIYAGVRYEM